MQSKHQHGISLLAIGIFVFIAFASIGPDPSTNTSVAIKDCEDKPPFGGLLNIHVALQVEAGDGEGDPVVATGKLFIAHQKVNADKTCTYTSSSQVIDFTTDFNGEYSYSGMPYTHNNSQDLFRIELAVNGDLFEHGPYKDVRVHYYDIPEVSFSKILPGILSGE